jgi:hypothetical protein
MIYRGNIELNDSSSGEESDWDDDQPFLRRRPTPLLSGVNSSVTGFVSDVRSFIGRVADETVKSAQRLFKAAAQRLDGLRENQIDLAVVAPEVSDYLSPTAYDDLRESDSSSEELELLDGDVQDVHIEDIGEPRHRIPRGGARGATQDNARCIEPLLRAWVAIKDFATTKPLPPGLRDRVLAGDIKALWRHIRRRGRSALMAYAAAVCEGVEGGFFGLMRVTNFLAYDVWGNNELVFTDDEEGRWMSIVGTAIADDGEIFEFHARSIVAWVELRNIKMPFLVDLAHHLQAYALFRQRDYNTLMMLKSKALAWGKDKHLSDSDMAYIIAGSVTVGFLPTIGERDAASLLNLRRPAQLVAASNRWPNEAPRYPTRTWRDWWYSWTDIFTRPTNLTA